MSRARSKIAKSQRPGGKRFVCRRCNKVAYVSQEAAEGLCAKITRFEYVDGVYTPLVFSAYLAPCGWWHVTSNSKAKAKANRNSGHA